MAKDPAFLFYPGDWQGGTMTMSRHIKGCYIDLLMAQFNSGPLSLEEIKTVLGNDFAAWGALLKKFKKTEQGLFFNERLEAEKTKRAEFSIQQKERIEKRWNKNGISPGNTPVLPLENENRNKNEIKNGKEVTGEKPKNLTDTQIKQVIEFANITMQKKYSEQRVKDLWEAFLIQNTKEPGNLNEKFRHFLNWLKFLKEENKNGNNTGKIGTSAARVEALRNWGTNNG